MPKTYNVVLSLYSKVFLSTYLANFRTDFSHFLLLTTDNKNTNQQQVTACAVFT